MCVRPMADGESARKPIEQFFKFSHAHTVIHRKQLKVKSKPFQLHNCEFCDTNGAEISISNFKLIKYFDVLFILHWICLIYSILRLNELNEMDASKIGNHILCVAN